MEQCSLCRFWLNWDSEMTNLGECHRFPPRVAAAHQGDVGDESADDRRWPLTSPDDWCGEFQRPRDRAADAPSASSPGDVEVGPGGI
jgi:hypothetical protein